MTYKKKQKDYISRVLFFFLYILQKTEKMLRVAG